MSDFASWTDLFACLGLMLVFIFGWGKAKTALAKMELKKAEGLLNSDRAEETIKCLEQVRKDLDLLPRYWYLLGLAFVRLGNAERAEEAFHRVLEIEDGYLNTKQLLAALGGLTQSPPAGAAACFGGDA